VAGRINYSVEPSASAIALEINARRRPIRNDGPDDQLPPAALGKLDLEAHLADPALKQRFVTPMFDTIAPRYDRFTRVFSFGMDRRWKAELIDWIRLAVGPESRVLDLACGTGDLALAAAERATHGSVRGVDASPRMIELARKRAAREAPHGNVQFQVGDMSSLEADTASVDAITAGYGLRNVPEYEVAVREIARVLKPGGRIGISDVVAEDRLSAAERAERGSFVGCIAGALSKGEYEAGLQAAGFHHVSVEFTHAVADGMHGAIVAARRGRA